MRRRNQRTKAIETLKKTDLQFPDPSSSRAHSDLKRTRKVTFNDVDHRTLDAKTSEFAFFKKLKSGFGLSSESSNSKSSTKIEQNPNTFESREYAGTDREAKDRCKSYSFSTPIHTTRGGSCGLSMSHANLTQRDKEKSSSAFSRDKDTVRSGNNLRSGGIGDEKGDLFSVKRKRLHQWVKDTWFPEIPELTSNGHVLVSVLLTRLFPGTAETHPSRFSTERTDRVKRRTFVDSPGSKFRKRYHERYTEVDDSLQMEKGRSIYWPGWLENSIKPSLQFATDHVHSSFIPRDNYSISYPKESVYRPPLLKQKASSLSFPVEETRECSPISSLHFRNHKPLSLDYHIEESEYSSEDLSHDHREPSSALLLEWNTETASTRKTNDLPLSYHTEVITYPNASSSSLTDNPWSSDYSSSHDLVTKVLYPLPLPSHYISDSFLLPTTNQTSYFEHELERHMIDDEDVAAANPNLQTFHHTYSSDCLTRDYTYYHNLSNSPVDHSPFKVPGCEIVSYPFSSISDSNLLEVSSPTHSDRFKSYDWIPFKFQSPQGWIDS
ncbi:unnamed protein product [Arabis nemorensis]|uniref:Uncharacterized protein n=1 Tax=Arabis nemorensis TaxID=586526 RepID=A0A565BDT4_9BRAS|nr:unnamed protein product [Arabis nemorensis]